MAYDQPQLMHRLLAVLADAVADYLSAQIRAGAQVVQILIPGWQPGAPAYQRNFAGLHVQRIISACRPNGWAQVPVIVFTKGGGQWLNAIAGSGAQAVGIDWTTDIGAAASRLGIGCRPCRAIWIPACCLRHLCVFGKRWRPSLRLRPGSARVQSGSRYYSPVLIRACHAAFVDAVQELSPRYHLAG